MTTAPGLIATLATRDAMSRWWSGRLVLAIGITMVAGLTLVDLARGSWSIETGAHGPLVLVTAAWLAWRRRAALAEAARQPLFPAILPLAVLVPLYVLARMTGMLVPEAFAAYGMLLTIAWLQLGPRVLQRFWFVALYLLCLVTPPEALLFALTHPLKLRLAAAAVDAASAMGLAVGESGTLLQVDGYQLLLASACSGINSLFGIAAIGLFYVYLRRGDDPAYAIALAALLLPVAITTNFLRILILIAITHWWGDQPAESVAHQAAGVGMFALAVMILFAIDSVLHPLVRGARR